MQLTCPSCNYSKQIDPAILPSGATRATCPRCKEGFDLPHSESAEAVIEEVVTLAESELSQAADRPNQAAIDARPKAGFWMRVVAALIDGTLVFCLQFVLGLLLVMAGFAAAPGGENQTGTMLVLVQLFGYALSFAYYVIFTGHGGQTPGKMALRIKVIRCDGSEISYGRAAFREIPAKFLSGIILCIGYLMVAFDEQKQGLHDRMADTYVIKL